MSQLVKSILIISVIVVALEGVGTLVNTYIPWGLLYYFFVFIVFLIRSFDFIIDTSLLFFLVGATLFINTSLFVLIKVLMFVRASGANK